MKQKWLNIIRGLIFIPLELFLFFIIVLFNFIVFKGTIPDPKISDVKIPERITLAENYYVIGDNYLKLNEYGVWEMYLEGTPYQRGLVYGALSKELSEYQEEVFVESINSFVPKGMFQNILKIFVSFFNSDIPKYISKEYQHEIYGVSRYFSDKYDYIGSKYSRILNYHAAHDLGHALNDYSVVGCTSFAVKNSKSENGELLVGRNFDFYVGDDFAKNKLLLIVKPSSGYAFSSVTWAGYMGVSSGINAQGLSVTINASKSDLPKSSKTPIGLLAREILQYAKNIDQAIAIAKKRQVFVSESILVASGEENRSVIIEISPNKFGVKEMTENTLVCANHYQSKTYQADSTNILNILNSDSKYRFDRMYELINSHSSLTPQIAAAILRDQKAEHGDTLGMGNPRAINQLLAHHSVIAQPKSSILYVSTSPYQLGTYIGLNLNKSVQQKKHVYDLTIEPDAFLNSKAYSSFEKYKATKQEISNFLSGKTTLKLTSEEINSFIASNSESYVTYEMLGNYFRKKGNNQQVIHYYEIALTKNVVSKEGEKGLQQLINTCKTKE